MGIPSEAPPSRTSRPPARDFSTDAAQDAVILPVQDLAAPGPPPSPGPPGHPARPPAVIPSAGRGTGAPPGPSRRPPPPSWGRVLLTTVQLWCQRHLHLRWPAQARWRVLALLILAAVLFGAGAISVALARSPAPAPHTRGGGQARTGRAPTPAAVQAAAAARTAAARWIAGQVSADAIVSCDPQICALLQAQGIPAARLLTLGGSNPAPLGSDLIVSTAAVRSEFGARLASVYAPSRWPASGRARHRPRSGSWRPTAARPTCAASGPTWRRGPQRAASCCAIPGSALPHRPAGPWPPARLTPGC